jgi:hypothetical protein
MHLSDCRLYGISDGTFVARPSYFGAILHLKFGPTSSIGTELYGCRSVAFLSVPGIGSYSSMPALVRSANTGHLAVVITSGRQRRLLLGDAITCPVQLNEPEWHSLGDVDVALANRTREQLWREMEDPQVIGVGSHFPGLRFGRVLPGVDRRWSTKQWDGTIGK